MKNKLAYLFALFALPVLANTPPVITNVRASQREGTKLVDIYYDAADADNDALKVRIEISDNDGMKYSVPAFTLTGDIGEGITPGTGKHIIWDAGTDWDGEYSDQMRVKVYAIDAQGFPGMEWGNEVPPGGFLMGQDGGAEGSGPSRHVNIPWSYWLSKYEITNQQYCDFLNAAITSGKVRIDGSAAVYSVMGTQVMPHLGGSYLLLNIGDDKDIRWNVNNFEVVGGCSNFPVRVTWYGAMMFASFYGYDLPTEAEWEKAVRGPDHDDQDEHLKYPWGNDLTSGYGNYKKSGDPYENRGTTPVGFYNGNQTPVGPDTINGYGLYDVCGNVAEWTLTTASDSFSVESYPDHDDLLSARNEPAYGVDGSSIRRGGDHGGTDIAIYARANQRRSDYTVYNGFRVIRRHGVERPASKMEVFEDFESWPIKLSIKDETVTSNAGNWLIEGSGKIVDDAPNAYSGNRYFCNVEDLYYHALYFPNLKGILVEVRMRVKNIGRYEGGVELITKDAVGNATYRSVKIEPDSGYRIISLSPAYDGVSYCIQCNKGLCVDDLEIWTIPRD